MAVNSFELNWWRIPRGLGGCGVLLLLMGGLDSKFGVRTLILPGNGGGPLNCMCGGGAALCDSWPKLGWGNSCWFVFEVGGMEGAKGGWGGAGMK